MAAFIKNTHGTWVFLNINKLQHLDFPKVVEGETVRLVVGFSAVLCVLPDGLWGSKIAGSLLCHCSIAGAETGFTQASYAPFCCNPAFSADSIVKCPSKGLEW